MEQGLHGRIGSRARTRSCCRQSRRWRSFSWRTPRSWRTLPSGNWPGGAGVSEPTVIRCVRGLGYRGYREFKGALSQKEGQVRGNALDYLGGFALRPWERMGDLPLKAVRTHRAQLEETLKSVPTGELERGRPDPGRGAIH